MHIFIQVALHPLRRYSLTRSTPGRLSPTIATDLVHEEAILYLLCLRQATALCLGHSRPRRPPPTTITDLVHKEAILRILCRRQAMPLGLVHSSPLMHSRPRRLSLSNQEHPTFSRVHKTIVICVDFSPTAYPDLVLLSASAEKTSNTTHQRISTEPIRFLLSTPRLRLRLRLPRIKQIHRVAPLKAEKLSVTTEHLPSRLKKINNCLQRQPSMRSHSERIENV